MQRVFQYLFPMGTMIILVEDGHDLTCRRISMFSTEDVETVHLTVDGQDIVDLWVQL